ncbi:hypothetical protein O181_099406 [Austropuccinia psidii MF-1]|uniref:Uncharacterized protein n=1 Tax=Austropuccinia psidii MF-1 TaxID=1389203 RepID=A0A9Q3JCR9_9BASI|nr:hypothetical protein [Austropuccinia psidii MF-1]
MLVGQAVWFPTKEEELKNRPGSVHDSDSEYSIEHVQTQSPISPNIPLTTSIAFSIHVSGINIYVGIVMAQNSSTLSIQNISITPIPMNPANTQMNVSEGPGSTPEISSKANPQSKYLCDFLLNLVESQETFGRTVEIYASFPLVHKEKVTGCHHPYASKARMGNASSSREKIVTDEDEKMSLTQSETNGEQRRKNFTTHEEGTQANSEFTHPQIPIAQSILQQLKMRQQRNQACKAHNVEKCASHMEEQRWLKAELPDNVHGMRSAVHTHFLFLLKVRNKDFSSLPAPPSTEELEISIQVDSHLGYSPKDFFNEPSTQV